MNIISFCTEGIIFLFLPVTSHIFRLQPTTHLKNAAAAS